MRIKIEQSTERSSVKSEIPECITGELLHEATFERIPVGTISATIDDYLIASMEAELSIPQMQEGVSDLLRCLEESFGSVQNELNTIEWDSIITPSQLQDVRQQLIKTAKGLGAPEDVLGKIQQVEFNFSDTMDISHAGDSAIVNRFQILRKAKDYITVFPEQDLKIVLRSLALTTLAHEAGHIIDTTTNPRYINLIPDDEVWLRSENKSERFAEFWGSQINMEGVSQEVRQQEKLIHVAKAKEMWDAVEVYAKAHPGIGVQQLFRLISEKANDSISAFVSARLDLYDGTCPEHYASPYSHNDLVPHTSD